MIIKHVLPLLYYVNINYKWSSGLPIWLELHCDLSFDVPEDICDYQFTGAASCQESTIFLIANGYMIIYTLVQKG